MGVKIMRHPWKLVASAAALAVLQACGGGGGGDGGGDNGGTTDDSAPALPTNLTFSGGLIDGVPMVVTAEGQSLPIGGFRFKGTWDRTANRYTLSPGDTSTNLDLGQSGVLAAGVTATASWVGFAPPMEAGTISVQSLANASQTPLFTGTASATVVSNTTVQTSWNGTTPRTTFNYSWDDFLNNILPTDWETGVQMGVAVLAHGVEKVQYAIDQFAFVNANDAQLKSAGTAGITQACAGGTGTRKVVWNDANGDGMLGPSDGFTVTFANCRIDIAGDIDQLLNGQIVISNYIENASPFSVGGRVDLVGLQQTETGIGGLSISTTGSIQIFIAAR
jgi:hypothetical protein